MNFLPSFEVKLRASYIALPLMFLLQATAQTNTPSKSPAFVQAVSVTSSQNGPALEILNSGPLTPAIQKLDNPLRIVIDLPNSAVVKKKYTDYRSLQIAAIRVNQFQNDPPVTRIVVDLLKPMNYSWDASGNKLIIHLHPVEDTPAAQPSVAALSRDSDTPSVMPVSTGGVGSVVLAGNRLTTGSSVTAGAEAAVLNLGRGGQVRVCPGTTISVATSPNGQDLMLGMSTGALEAHYNLQSSADSVLTPDFRILLEGPGEFHYAISADSRGNTCVRALPGNTAGATVSELMGDGTYRVKASEQVVFRSGRLSTIDSAVPVDCGCPAPNNSLQMASETPRATSPEQKMPESMQLSRPGDEAKPTASNENAASGSTAGSGTGSNPSNPQAAVTAAGPETAAIPETAKGVHVQVEAPFVFRASDLPGPASPTSSLALVANTNAVADMPVTSTPPQSLPTTIVLAPSAPTPNTHHGVLGKIKGFFSAIFG